MPLARIAVGANLDEPGDTVREAITALGRLGVTVRVSSLYRTKPWGVVEQPDFVNAVVLLETQLEPRALLEELKALERAFGRTQGVRFGPRRLDLDILAYDDRRVDEPDLVIPHPRLHERAFVLVPLAEIDPSYASLRDALSPEERAGVKKLPPAPSPP